MELHLSPLGSLNSPIGRQWHSSSGRVLRFRLERAAGSSVKEELGCSGLSVARVFAPHITPQGSTDNWVCSRTWRSGDIIPPGDIIPIPCRATVTLPHTNPVCAHVTLVILHGIGMISPGGIISTEEAVMLLAHPDQISADCICIVRRFRSLPVLVGNSFPSHFQPVRLYGLLEPLHLVPCPLLARSGRVCKLINKLSPLLQPDLPADMPTWDLTPDSRTMPALNGLRRPYTWCGNLFPSNS